MRRFNKSTTNNSPAPSRRAKPIMSSLKKQGNTALRWKSLFIFLIVVYVVGNIILHRQISTYSTTTKHSTASDAVSKEVPRDPKVTLTNTGSEQVNRPYFSRDPILEKGCMLRFKDEKMMFCHEGNKVNAVDRQVGYLIGQRLLEYHYHCSVETIPVVDVTKESRDRRRCLWVGSGPTLDYLQEPNDLHWDVSDQSNYHSPAHPALLIGEIFQDYYWLPTKDIGKKLHKFRGNRCIVDASVNDATAQSMLKHHVIVTFSTSDKDMHSFLDKLRFCDRVESSSLMPLIMADALGIPNLALEPTADQRNWKEQYETYLKSTNRTLSKWSDRLDLKPLSAIDRQFLASKIANSFPYHLVAPSNSVTPSTNKDLKTLVIIMGNIRGGDAAWNTFYKHMLDLNSADLALVIGQVSKEKRTSSLFARAKYLYEFPEFDDWAVAVDACVNTTIPGHWKPYILPYANDKWGTWGGIGDKKGSGAIIFMMRWYVSKFLLEYKLLDQYDRFVVTRSDHYYGCDHDLSLLDNDFMWIPIGEDYKFGVTDRHLVCNRAQILKALNIYPPILQYPEKYASPQFAELNPEQLLRLRWEEERLWPWVRRFDRVMFTCAVKGDMTRWTEMSEEAVKEGVFLKYTYEYQETTCVCKTGPCNFAYTKRKMRVGYPPRPKES